MYPRQRSLLGKLLLLLFIIAWGFMIPRPFALAQIPYPTRLVSICVGFSPGGGTDITLRALMEAAEKSLGQKIITLHKPGGGGTVSVSLLAKGKPDGYTIGFSTSTPIVKTPHMVALDYDPFQDLDYILAAGKFKNVIVVRSDSPFKKWEDVVDWAKKNPGQLVYGHPGLGTGVHLAFVRAAKKAGFTFKNVPFAGDPPTINAVLGGHIMVGGGSSLPWRPHIEAKAAQPLLVLEAVGLDYAPDVPVFKKVLFDYDQELPSINLLYAPKGITDPVREKLEKAFLDGMKSEKFQTVAKEQELMLTEPLVGKGLLDYVKKSYFIYDRVTKEAGIYKGQNK